MTDQPPSPQRASFDGYGRFYGPIAVLLTTVLFLPILDDVVLEDESGSIAYRYGNLWEMAGGRGGSPAVLAILLSVTLIGLLVAAAVRPDSSWRRPAGIACLAVLIAIMLLAKPGVGDPAPGLTPFGTAGLVLAIQAGGLGALHAVHAASVARRYPGG